MSEKLLTLILSALATAFAVEKPQKTVYAYILITIYFIVWNCWYESSIMDLNVM